MEEDIAIKLREEFESKWEEDIMKERSAWDSER